MRHDKATEFEIVDLARELMAIPAITTGSETSPADVDRCFQRIRKWLVDCWCNPICFEGDGKSPALYCDAANPGQSPCGTLLFAGHFDRVAPQAPGQLDPLVDGEWLRGRGAADMLAVVATLMVFLKDLRTEVATGHMPAPDLGILLVGNEEPGEAEPWGTPHVLAALKQRFGYAPTMLVAGERTGEGALRFGKVECRNRGLTRVHLTARGVSGHTALASGLTAVDRILAIERSVRAAIPAPRERGWSTTFMVPYLLAGEVMNFNTTPATAMAGFEVRPVPKDDAGAILSAILNSAEAYGVEAAIVNHEAGVETPGDDPRVRRILGAVVAEAGGGPADHLGKGKLPATQARFAPPGCAAVVWGQSGVGPHAPDEAHWIPSIMPYYRMLWRLAQGSKER